MENKEERLKRLKAEVAQLESEITYSNHYVENLRNEMEKYPKLMDFIRWSMLKMKKDISYTQIELSLYDIDPRRARLVDSPMRDATIIVDHGTIESLTKEMNVGNFSSWQTKSLISDAAYIIFIDNFHPPEHIAVHAADFSIDEDTGEHFLWIRFLNKNFY